MKKKITAAVAVAAIIAAFAIFFALQATPSNVLNFVRAENLEIVDGVMTVPAKYTVIEAEAVAGKTDFSKLIIEGETKIEYHAFYACTNLREVILENSCEIGEGAFADCPALVSASVYSVGGSCADDAFSGHGGLTIYCREGSAVEAVALKSDISCKFIEE